MGFRKIIEVTPHRVVFNFGTLDRQTGRLLWEKPTEPHRLAEVGVAAGDTLYVSSTAYEKSRGYPDSVSAFSLADGALLGTTQVGSDPQARVRTIVAHRGALYVLYRRLDGKGDFLIKLVPVDQGQLDRSVSARSRPPDRRWRYRRERLGEQLDRVLAGIAGRGDKLIQDERLLAEVRLPIPACYLGQQLPYGLKTHRWPHSLPSAWSVYQLWVRFLVRQGLRSSKLFGEGATRGRTDSCATVPSRD